MPDIFVQSFTHLSDMPKSDRALAMLQKVASLVKPIMRKHSWVLAVLSEFFPESPNLVGKTTPIHSHMVVLVHYLTYRVKCAKPLSVGRMVDPVHRRKWRREDTVEAATSMGT